MEVSSIRAIGVDRGSSDVLQVGVPQDAEVRLMRQEAQQDQVCVLRAHRQQAQAAADSVG